MKSMPDLVEPTKGLCSKKIVARQTEATALLMLILVLCSSCCSSREYWLEPLLARPRPDIAGWHVNVVKQLHH